MAAPPAGTPTGSRSSRPMPTPTSDGPRTPASSPRTPRDTPGPTTADPPAESDNAQRGQRYTWKRIPAYGDDQQSLLENSKSRRHYQRLHAHDQAAA